MKNHFLFPALAFLALAMPTGRTEPTPESLQAYRQVRRELAYRKRGIIFNNDGCDALYFPRKLASTPENFLNLRTTALAGTQVGTIAYCTISSGFSNFTHRTKVGSILARDPAGSDYAKLTRNATADFIKQGTDPLRMVIEYSHTHQMEAFWSMRMNDTHDAAHRPDRPYFLFPDLKVQHPGWLVGGPIKRTRVGRWSSVDYARPEIRELAFQFIQEVCRNYDVDGIELDFFRHLCYFKSTARGGKASSKELELMTGLIRKIRKMTEQVGLKRKRPILVSVRVPDSTEYSRELGLDIEQWLQEDLIDILVTTGYFRLNPWKYSVDLGHKYGVAVYPCLSDSRVRGQTRFRRMSTEAYRGRAMNALAAGADGVHLFNNFNPKSNIYRELGNMEPLRTLDKLYFVTVRDGNPDSFLAGGSQYRTTVLFSPFHPGNVSESSPLKLKIMIGDDFEKLENGPKPVVKLHLRATLVRDPRQLEVSLNGHPLARAALVNGWADFPVEPAWTKPGPNEIVLDINNSFQVDSSDWSLVYEGDRKPPKIWRRDRGSTRTEEEIKDGALRISDKGNEPGDYLYYRYPWGADPDGESVIEARVKVISGRNQILLSDGRAHDRLAMFPDRIEMWSKTSRNFHMDTTDRFHVYRMEIRGRDIRVFVDGQLRIDAPNQFINKYASAQNEVAFGAASSTDLGQAWWKSFKFRVRSQPVEDLVVSVTFPK